MQAVRKDVRNYARVSDELRQQLIALVDNDYTIKEAASMLGIKYENAKIIYRVYIREGRDAKKKTRIRKKKRQASDMAALSSLAEAEEPATLLASALNQPKRAPLEVKQCDLAGSKVSVAAASEFKLPSFATIASNLVT